MRRISVVFVALVAMAVPASAGVVEGMFEIEGGCFVRKYDAAHMRSHPGQLVTQISLETSASQTERRRLALSLEFEIRDGAHYSAEAYCTRADDVCSIEGDGGSFSLSRKGGQVRLSVGDFLAVEGDTDFSPDLATSDDRVFLLDPC